MDEELDEAVTEPADPGKTYEEPVYTVTPGEGTASGRPAALVRARTVGGDDDGIYIRGESRAYYPFSDQQLRHALAMIQHYLDGKAAGS